MEKEQVNLKNMAINYTLQIVVGMIMFATTYWIFIWDANLYNALVTVDDRTWREWAFIVGSVFAGPLILLGFIAFIRDAWYGTMFDSHFPPRMKR